VKRGKLYRLTEKGEEIFGDIWSGFNTKWLIQNLIILDQITLTAGVSYSKLTFRNHCIYIPVQNLNPNPKRRPLRLMSS
jgi:hypothetical protein